MKTTVLFSMLLSLGLFAIGCAPAPEGDSSPTVTEPAIIVDETPDAVHSTDVPATDVPATDYPAADEPATDLPAADEPATDLPASDEPIQPPAQPIDENQADSLDLNLDEPAQPTQPLDAPVGDEPAPPADQDLDAEPAPLDVE